ncbi:MAG TPA: hypothetical protein VGL09_05360 [Methylomirabilota bacterium]
MRLGCGCLGVVVLLVAATGLGGGAWVASRLLQRPADVPLAGSPADGQRAQQKIYEMGRASRSAPHGAEAIVITEAELNAFLSRHVIDAVDVPLTDLAVRMVGGDGVQIYGRTTLRGVLADPPLSNAIAALPARWQRQNIWLRFDGTVRVEAATNGKGRMLRIDLDRLWVGRQPLPAVCARLAFDPAVLALLRWRVPARLETVSIEPGRAIIRPASAR